MSDSVFTIQDDRGNLVAGERVHRDHKTAQIFLEAMLHLKLQSKVFSNGMKHMSLVYWRSAEGNYPPPMVIEDIDGFVKYWEENPWQGSRGTVTKENVLAYNAAMQALLDTYRVVEIPYK